MWKVSGWTFNNKNNDNDYDNDVNDNDVNDNNYGDDEDNSLDHKKTEKKKAKEIRHHTRARIKRVQCQTHCLITHGKHSPFVSVEASDSNGRELRLFFRRNTEEEFSLSSSYISFPWKIVSPTRESKDC